MTVTKIVKKYRYLYKVTDLSTAQIISKLCLEFDYSENTMTNLLFCSGAYSEYTHRIAKRERKLGPPKKGNRIPIEEIVNRVNKYWESGMSFTKATHQVAVELDCTRVNIVRRYNRHGD